MLKVREKILNSCLDLPCAVLDATLSLNYPPNVCNSFASLVFYFYSLDENNELVLPALRQFLVQQYCSSSTVSPAINATRVTFVEEKLTKISHQSKSINEISHFQSVFSDICSDFIEKLVKNKLEVPPQITGAVHMIR